MLYDTVFCDRRQARTMTRLQPSNTLGIDFGTSNSAAGVLVNGKPHLIELEPGRKTLPTSVFFDAESNRMLIGTAANTALTEGEEGRFMRSLKSVLGTPLMHEKRRLMGKSMSFVDIIAHFLAQLKSRAEAACHQPFERALSGRPVHFHSTDAGRDAQALADLTECYHRAGFTDVAFLFEPEAAAIATSGLQPTGGLSLIVDIGGGTSDFSVFRHDATNRIEILASHGIRLGGTNFDRSISVDHVMPLFGRGSEIRNEMGPGTMTAPNAIFQDLATWQKIPFLYTPDTQRKVARMQKLAVQPNLFARFSEVLEHQLGHDIAFAVERGKIQANDTGRTDARIDLRFVERDLGVALREDGLSASLDAHRQSLHDSAMETLAIAGCTPAQITQVIFVGGSSLMGIVEAAMMAAFPQATREYPDVFTAVVDGLAIASQTAFET